MLNTVEITRMKYIIKYLLIAKQENKIDAFYFEVFKNELIQLLNTPNNKWNIQKELQELIDSQ